MSKLNIKSFIAFLFITISYGLLLVYVRHDIYMIGYTSMLYLYALFCAYSIQNRVTNTFFVFGIFYSILLLFGPLILYKERFQYYECVGNYIIISFLFFVIGYKFCESINYKNKRLKIFLPATKNHQTIWILSIIIFCISIAAYGIYFIKSWSLLFGGDLENGRVTAMKGNGLLLWLGDLCWLAIFMLYEQRLMHDKYKKTVNCMIVIAAVFSILLGFRNALVNPVLVLFFMKNKRKEISLYKMVIAAVALSAFVGIYGALRSGGGSAVDAFFHEFKVSSVNLNSIFEAFPKTVDYQYGKTFLLDWIALVNPQVEGTTLWMKDVLHMTFDGGGVTPTLVGEFFINWGLPGVMIGMTLVGVFFKKIDKVYNDPESSIVLPCVFLGYIRPIIRGGIANSSTKLVVLIRGYCICQAIAKEYKVRVS